jgi:hypothetical protein
MNFTPQKAMTSASVSAARLLNDGVPFFFQPFDFCEQIKALQIFAGR